MLPDSNKYSATRPAKDTRRGCKGGSRIVATSLEATAYESAWLTDTAWITGVAGVVTILGGSCIFGTMSIKPQHASILGVAVDQPMFIGALATLGVTAATMVVVELIRLWCLPNYQFFSVHPEVRNGRWLPVVNEAIKRYALLAALFFVCRFIYHSAREYGFRVNHPFYQLWFVSLEILWRLYLVGGLPYILLTLAYKHNPDLDKKDYSLLIENFLRILWSWLKPKAHRTNFNDNDKRCLRGLLVKLFFAPVMTVFFLDNFVPLQSNMSYLAGNVIPGISNGTYDTSLLAKDLANFAKTVIFSLDVGLAWCGYVVTSRWVDNQTVSAEPTLLGWAVCLISYPPFRAIVGWYLIAPGDTLYMAIPYDWVTGLFGFLMILSFFFYMLPTIWFGIRFSNLTHRGIIRTGPYAIVRHPAYATKNIAWWVVGLPTIVYVGVSSDASLALLYFIGLILGSCIYYLRAVTEERHLGADPDYLEYCQHVKYRFIPGVF